MCARYVFFSGKVFTDELGILAVPDLTPQYNIAPTDLAPVIVEGKTGRSVRLLKWGLVPSWAKDATGGVKLINARAEGIQDKPSFRNAMRWGRCLVPADGFYEWKGEGKDKQPYFVSTPDAPFAFAGLREKWQGPEGEIQTFTIITTEPNGPLAELHNRMPVILARDEFDRWLDRDVPLDSVLPLLDPYPDQETIMHAVDRRVGNVKNDDPELIRPISTGSLFD